MCINSPSFDNPFKSSVGSSSSSMQYWLEKYDECERRINERVAEIKRFEGFRASLDAREVIILDKYFMGAVRATSLAKELEVSRSRFYELVNSICRKTNA